MSATCFSSSLDTTERSEIGLYSVWESDGGEVLGIGITVESFQVEGKIPNSIERFKGTASRPHIEPLLGAHISETVVANSKKIEAAVEALARIVYKPTKSASSIKLMKLAKHKVTPFQAIKLTCALESEVQTLKATVSQHEEDSNRELFPVPCWEVRFFAYTIAVCSVRCIYLGKTLCYGLAHVLRNLHSKAGLVLKNTDWFSLSYDCPEASSTFMSCDRKLQGMCCWIWTTVPGYIHTTVAATQNDARLQEISVWLRNDGCKHWLSTHI